MNLIEIFTGCGGLAFGLSEAGLRPIKLLELNAHAHETVVHNKTAGVRHVRAWPAELGDVRSVDWRPFCGRALVLAGGPPCQPFSQAGLAGGESDKRNMWPETIRAVREIGPPAFLFENVRGLMRKSFHPYFASILEDLRSSGPQGYSVVHAMVDAADYGAPQRRHRVIVAGFRRDLAADVQLPTPTHSRDRLLWDQWVTGTYWAEHGIERPSDNRIHRPDVGLVARLRKERVPPKALRWRTVRDALKGLGEPNNTNCHIGQPGAKSYKGHTGSELDQPAKALKAGMHGVPGGENMMRLADGSVRYFTIREMARLQGLPDEFAFPGTWTESTRQLGNAVPVPLAKSFGGWIAATIQATTSSLPA